MNPLILASASPRRAVLLKQWNIAHRVIPSHALELTQETAPYLTAIELVQTNAFLKAKQIAKLDSKYWVLGVDTIVVHQDKVFGKPCHLPAAKSMLQQLSGKTHRVISGLALVKYKSPYSICHLSFDVSHVTFKTLSLEQIEIYLKHVPVLDKAGAYAVQEKGDWIIKAIEGSSSNVMGLPKKKTLQLLTKAKS